MTKKYLRPKLSYLILLFLFLISFIWPALGKAAPQDFIINEIMYNLPGSDTDREWIELKNIGSEPITLIGGSGSSSWRFFDGSNHTLANEALQGSMTIPPNDFAILASDAQTFLNEHPGFSKTVIDTTMSLSNTQDTLKLSADKGQTWFSEITYQSSMGANGNGRTLERQPDGSLRESSVDGGTPGAENSPPSTQPPPSEQPSPIPELSLPQLEPEGEEIVALTTIKEARQKTKGAEVLVEGIITVAPGTFSESYFYIQDQTAGIQIYFSKDFPALLIGQKVRILGTLSEAYNEKRIKIAQTGDITILGQEKEPAPITLKTGQVNEEYEGRLVKVSGKVVESSGSTFYLDDTSGKIKIYIKKEAKIEKPRLKKGEEIEITGIVSQYKDTYRILPRKTEDLKTKSGEVLIEAKKKEETGEGGENEEEEGGLSSEEKAKGEKVLGAFAEKSKQNWWWILLGLVILGGGGYLGYDYILQKRKGNSKIWSKIGPTFERWRNYWAHWRARRR
jgi:DNA/RNA endonuclease YhcR with UshA esterase domain